MLPDWAHEEMLQRVNEQSLAEQFDELDPDDEIPGTRRGLTFSHFIVDEPLRFEGVHPNHGEPDPVQAMLEGMARGRELAAAAHAILAERRGDLIRQVGSRYGVTLYPHPRAARVVVVSRGDYDTLRGAIATDPTLDPIGRGYYWWLGGELSVLVAPDWTCDPTRVALARLYALAVVPWARPVVRAVTRLLRRRSG